MFFVPDIAAQGVIVSKALFCRYIGLGSLRLVVGHLCQKFFEVVGLCTDNTGTDTKGNIPQSQCYPGCEPLGRDVASPLTIRAVQKSLPLLYPGFTSPNLNSIVQNSLDWRATWLPARSISPEGKGPAFVRLVE